METTTKTKAITCGFCDTGAHARCPWGIRNGDGQIVLCTCRLCFEAEHRRCTECNNSQPEEVGDAWKCLDRDACLAEQQRRIDSNPFVQQMQAVRAAREAAEKAQEALGRARAAARPTRATEAPPEAGEPAPQARVAGGRDCLCDCGGQTKGGKFLPGHDSKYLNRLVGAPGPDSQAAAYAISDAFGAKYDKRVK